MNHTFLNAWIAYILPFYETERKTATVFRSRERRRSSSFQLFFFVRSFWKLTEWTEEKIQRVISILQAKSDFFSQAFSLFFNFLCSFLDFFINSRVICKKHVWKFFTRLLFNAIVASFYTRYVWHYYIIFLSAPQGFCNCHVLALFCSNFLTRIFGHIQAYFFTITYLFYSPFCKWFAWKAFWNIACSLILDCSFVSFEELS